MMGMVTDPAGRTWNFIRKTHCLLPEERARVCEKRFGRAPRFGICSQSTSVSHIQAHKLGAFSLFSFISLFSLPISGNLPVRTPPTSLTSQLCLSSSSYLL